MKIPRKFQKKTDILIVENYFSLCGGTPKRNALWHTVRHPECYHFGDPTPACTETKGWRKSMSRYLISVDRWGGCTEAINSRHCEIHTQVATQSCGQLVFGVKLG